jgi:DNA polymerase-1
MAFIFRAYHAMQRQRPMSTRTGIPTAATYVFVNMINKLRKDFAPQYLAAVYDLSAPSPRRARREMKGVRKWNIKTQQFETVDYAGYKANRAETPADLIQQLPYIRRALEAFRIPILTTRASRPTTSSARSVASSPRSATTSSSSARTRT